MPARNPGFRSLALSLWINFLRRDETFMNRAAVFGVLTSLLGLGGLVRLLSVGSHLPVIQWPSEAFDGLVFFFAWTFGLPDGIAWLASAVVFVAVAVGCFVIGYRFARLFSGGMQREDSGSRQE